MAVTREKLYDEIWTDPITKVAIRYGVSDSFLVRICKRLNVPHPPRGYWAKLAAGKASPRPPLPDVRPGDELEWARNGTPRRVPCDLPKPPDSPQTRARRKADRPAIHSLVAGARAHFENVRETETGYLKPSKRLLPDLIVTKGTLERAFDVANELFLLLEDYGYHVSTAPRDSDYRRADVDELQADEIKNHFPGLWCPYAPTVAFVGTVAIGLTLFEISERVEMRYINGKYVPIDQVPKPELRSRSFSRSWTTKQDVASGRLCLQAYSPYHGTSWKQQWRETASVNLLSKLKTIARELAEAASGIAKQAEEADRLAKIRHKEWELQREQWRREEAERRRLEAIKESRKELLAIIAAWDEAQRIERFFRETEQLVQGLSNEDRLSLMTRLREARAQLGGPDALHRFLAWRSAEERLKEYKITLRE